MNCQFCGSAIPEGDQFCGQCGARAPVTGGPPASGAAGPSYEQTWGKSRPAIEPQTQPGARPAAPREPWQQAYYDRDPNAPAVAARYVYAGFWVRFGAWLLDSIFALLLSAIPAAILAIVLVLLVEANQEPALTFAEAEQQDDDTGAAAVIGIFLGAIPVWIAYWYIGTSLGGAWGKRIFGLRIVKQESGDRPGFGTGAVRVLVTWLISLINLAQLLDHLWMIWDKDKQTWHDKAAGTVVVHL
jgi:uncharacterized RDD family membrane protein YckC